MFIAVCVLPPDGAGGVPQPPSSLRCTRAVPCTHPPTGQSRIWPGLRLMRPRRCPTMGASSSSRRGGVVTAGARSQRPHTCGAPTGKNWMQQNRQRFGLWQSGCQSSAGGLEGRLGLAMLAMQSRAHSRGRSWSWCRGRPRWRRRTRSTAPRRRRGTSPAPRSAQVTADRPRPFVVMRVRRQIAIGQVDAPAIEELAAGRDRDEHSRVAVLDDADGRRSVHSSFHHAVWPIMNRSLGPGLLRRERSPGVHPHGMPGWITDKPDGSRAVWEVEGESGNECSTQFFRLLAALLNVQHLNIDHAVEGTDLPLRDLESSRWPIHPKRFQPPDWFPERG